MLNKTIFAAIALMGASLVACVPEPPVSPGQIANKTVLDEKAGIAIETAYAAAAQAATFAMRGGFVHAEQAEKIAEIDNRAYAAVQATRAAYDAGNASSYAEASATALPLLRELVAAIKGDSR